MIEAKAQNRKIIVLLLLLCSIFIAGRAFFSSAYVVPVIMYHHIDENSATSRLSVSPESFGRQMEFLRSRKYNVIPLEGLISLLKEKKRLPPKTIAITFDDGNLDNYTNAYPVLKKFNLPAAIFVIVNDANGKSTLTWDQMREMQENNITIGSHTLSHPFLPSETLVVVREQIFQSKRILEEKLRRRVTLFSYPSGGFNEKVRQLVIEAGYAGAVATNPGKKYPKHDIYALKRLRISNSSDSLFVFWIEISGLYTWIKEHRDED